MAKSILQTKKECFLTGRTDNLHKHHIYFGTGLRKISEKYGFWVYLTGAMHNQSDEGVHGKNGHSHDSYLKILCQLEFEKTHSREEFMKIIGKNYISAY
jgi:hypothetical protein